MCPHPTKMQQSLLNIALASLVILTTTSVWGNKPTSAPTTPKVSHSQLYKNVLRAKAALQQSLRAYAKRRPTHKAILLQCKGLGTYHGHTSSPGETRQYEHVLSLWLDKTNRPYRYVESYRKPGARRAYRRAITIRGRTASVQSQRQTKHLTPKALQQWKDRFALWWPVLLIKRALRNPTRLQWVSGTRKKVVVFTDRQGAMRQLTIDPKSAMLTRVERLLHHPVLGDGVERISYGDKEQIHQQKWGSTNRQWRCKWRTVRHKPGPAIRPQTRTVQIQKVGTGLHVLELLAHNHRVLLVEFANGIGVIEAPKNDRVGRLVLASLRRRFPKKPVLYLFLTHHHPDHAGGFRPFVKQNIPIVTTKGNQTYLTTLAEAPQELASTNTNLRRGKPKWVWVQQKRIFKDAKQTMEVYDVGPETFHTREHLIYYFPKQKLLFEGDLGNLLKGKSRPASRRGIALYQSIAKRKLKVRYIVQSWPMHQTKRLIPFSLFEKQVRQTLAKRSK